MPSQLPPSSRRPSSGPRQEKTEQSELKGPLAFLERNRQLLGWINLAAAIFLLYFAISGFMQGRVFLPFGYGIMGLYFFYGYVQNTLKVNFGKLAGPFNLLLLVGALGCLVIGLLNNN